MKNDNDIGSFRLRLYRSPTFRPQLSNRFTFFVCSREVDRCRLAPAIYPKLPVLACADGIPYSLRSFLIGDHGSECVETHILVLIERVIKHHKINIETIRKEFELTKREGEVVRLICQGFANREISETLYISKSTVKVHIKNIMKKMKVSSRGEISATCK